MASGRPPVLLGRVDERSAFDRLLTNIRDGQSTALVVRGEAGVGKTTLLNYCAPAGRRCSGAAYRGRRGRLELPFAALHQLCAPILPRLDKLPEPQQTALSVALGLATGRPADRFLVGLAVLGLLSAAAEERPLACLVEDAQRLDATSRIYLAAGRGLRGEISAARGRVGSFA